MPFTDPSTMVAGVSKGVKAVLCIGASRGAQINPDCAARYKAAVVEQKVVLEDNSVALPARWTRCQSPCA